jgi:hypothetical protein
MAVFERAATSAPFPQDPKVEGLVEDKANQRKVAALLHDVFMTENTYKKTPTSSNTKCCS